MQNNRRWKMSPDIYKIFLQGLKLLSIKLGNHQIEQFSVYLDELKKWNERFNLIGPATDGEIIEKHFLDSLSIVSLLPTLYSLLPASILDVGTGAGLPGVPIKIAQPEISLTLLDSSKKKTEFLRHLCKKLDIKVEIICDRAENTSKISTYKNKYDFVVARAVAKISTSEKLCLPFLKNCGTLILQIGNKLDAELKQGMIIEKIAPLKEILPGRAILLIKPLEK
ncbi:MAG: 16S rRNA (guanine(527)-N(7))-methyltransferase RsmG [Elusimicrobiota bacterium]